jgi:hypothetical protein
MSTSDKIENLLELTADLWNEWLKIPEHEKHPSDNSEMCTDIHHIQNRLMALQNRKHK